MPEKTNPATTATNPRIAKLIELEVSGRIKPEHQTELDTYRAQGLAPKKSSGNSLTEYQGKSTGFYERAIGADRDFASAGEGGSPVGFMGDMARAVLPENVVNANTSPERQRAQQAKKDFILASLRYESGAAIGQNEYENQEKVFFPQTGDSPETIAQKAEARRRVIESLKVAAGPGAANKATPPLDKSGLGTPVIPGSTGDKLNQNPLKPEQQQAYDAWMKANPKASPDQLRSFGSSLGVDFTNAEAIVSARDKGAGFQPGATAREKAPDISDVRGKGGIGEGADAFVRGAADTPTFGFADELAAAGDTLFKGGTMDDNLSRQRAIDAYDAKNSPWLRGSGQFLGGVAIPIGSGARTVGQLAGVGGATGAAYGFGSGDGIGERLGNAAVNGVIGTALGAGLGKLGDIWRRRGGGTGGPGSPPPASAGDVAEASRDLAVPMLPGDVGGTPTSLASSFMRMTPGGAQPIVSAARKSQEAAGNALSRIAGAEGAAMDAEAAGEAVRRGALKYRSSSRDAVGRVYDRAAEEAGDARVTPKQALETLDGHIAQLSEVPGGAAGLSVLNELRDDIANRGTVTVNGIRGMRTQLRQKFMKDGLRGSDVERRVNEVIDAASEDLAQSLEDQGREAAAKTYREADRQWAERIKTLDDTIMPIIGKKGEKSGEQITSALNAAAKGNNARLAKLFDTLPEEEAGAARASMIEGLGRANAGAQNANGDAFSFNTFLTNWNKVGNSAKNAMFSGDNRKAIDQLALLAEKSKNAAKWQNYSNTGIGVLGIATGAVGDMATIGGTIAGQYALGRLLASPNVAKAMLRIAQAKTPEAIRSRIGSLSELATKDAALAPEISGLQSRLLDAMNDNRPISAAASDNNEQNQR